jgi:hypothetical protein
MNDDGEEEEDDDDDDDDDNNNNNNNNNNRIPEKRNKFWGLKRVRRLGLTTLPPYVSRLSRQCGILNISQPYRPPRPVTEIALLCYMSIQTTFVPHRGHTHKPPRPFTGTALQQQQNTEQISWL